MEGARSAPARTGAVGATCGMRSASRRDTGSQRPPWPALSAVMPPGTPHGKDERRAQPFPPVPPGVTAPAPPAVSRGAAGMRRGSRAGGEVTWGATAASPAPPRPAGGCANRRAAGPRAAPMAAGAVRKARQRAGRGGPGEAVTAAGAGGAPLGLGSSARRRVRARSAAAPGTVCVCGGERGVWGAEPRRRGPGRAAASELLAAAAEEEEEVGVPATVAAGGVPAPAFSHGKFRLWEAGLGVP